MPMMADIDDPPQSRARGILLGLGIGIPIVLVIGLWFLPALHARLVGGAAEFDERLRQEDAYMHGLCNDALDVDRDEKLCSCALGAEFPSLDCRPQFMAWSIDRQYEQCQDEPTREQALSFCACVDTLVEMIEKAEHERDARQAVGRYDRCAELPDALYLPTLDRLVPDGAPAPTE